MVVVAVVLEVADAGSVGTIMFCDSSTVSTTGVGCVMITRSGGRRKPGTSGGVCGGGVVHGEAPETAWKVNTWRVHEQPWSVSFQCHTPYT